MSTGWVPTNPGWGAAATAAKKQSAKTGAAASQGAAEIGSPAWLANASSGDLAVYAGTLQPDYSGVVQDPTKMASAAADYAKQGAAAWLAPQEDAYASQQNVSLSQRKLATDAATNFTQALSSILTGGLEGQEGRDYALKTFGGSYLGEVQAVQGQKMFIDITRDFNQNDFQLLQKIDAARQQQPDIYNKLYADFYGQEIDNQKQGIALADSTYDHRMKAAALLIASRQHTEDQNAKAANQKPDVRNFSDGTSRQLNPRTGMWEVVSVKAPTPVKLSYTKDAAGNLVALNPTTGVSAIVNPPGWTLKPPKTPAQTKVTVKTDKAGHPYTIVNGKIQMLDVPDGFTTTQPKATGQPTATVLSKADEYAKQAFYGMKPNASGKLVPAYTLAGFDPQNAATWGGEPTGQRNYQATISRLQSIQKLSLADAQKIADQYFQPGDFGRPAFSFQQRAALKKAGVKAADIKHVQNLYNVGSFDSADAARAALLGRLPAAPAPNPKNASLAGGGGAIGTALSFADKQVGLPYLFGSESPGKSFDCSGLIQAAYAQAGIKIGRDTYHQIKEGRQVSLADIQPGDLVFPSPHHVVMYVGGGQVIAAPHTGTVVQYQPLSSFGTNPMVRRIVDGGLS